MRWMQVACIAALTLVPTLGHAAGQSRGLSTAPASKHAATPGPTHRSIAPKPRAFHRYFAIPYRPAYYDFNGDLVVFVEVPEPPRALNCKRTQETRIVPSAIWGTREITITRC
jgi:hypothetical protein